MIDDLGKLLRCENKSRLSKLLVITTEFFQDGHCPGHVTSRFDPKVCAKCGVHADINFEFAPDTGD